MKYAALAAPLFLLCGAAAPTNDLRIVMVDVEGGGATLMVSPEGKSVLFDTGWPAGQSANPGDRPAPESSAERIVAAAKKLGLTKIDYLVITHYHLDHVGGVSDLLGRFPVGTLIDHGDNKELLPPDADPNAPNMANRSANLFKRYETLAQKYQHRVVKPGDRIDVGSLRLDVVTSGTATISKPLVAGGAATPGCDTPPAMDQDGGVENPNSVGVVASFGKTRILHMGDATKNIEMALVCPVNKIGPIDLLVVSHHGSGLSSSSQLLGAIAPRVALMGNGPRKGGDKQVFEALAAAPSKPVLWQQHAATRSPEVDRPESYVVNPNGPTDAGLSIEATVSPSGVIKVTNPRNGFSETYQAASR